MGAFLEVFVHVLGFDWFWFVNYVLGNLQWFFAFFAAAFINRDGKNYLSGFLAIVLYLFASGEFVQTVGWSVYVASFLFLHFLVRVVLIIFAADLPKLKNNLLAVLVIQFVVTVTVFNLFLQ